jgi:small subunit ribosomal protein S20
MPLTKSAAKAARQSRVRQTRLTPFKTRMKTTMKNMIDSVQEKKETDAVKNLSAAFKAIDTAAKKGLIHRKTADRRKSRLSLMLAGLQKKK